MKRLLVVCLGLVTAASFMPSDLTAEIGVKMGASLAKFKWTEPEPPGLTLESLPFVAGGLYGLVNFGVVALRPELLVLRKGGRYAAAGDSLEFRLTYIQVPLFLDLNVLREGPVRPFLSVGGYGAFLYRAEAVLTIGSERTVVDVMEDYQRVDFGLVASAGFGFNFSGFTISIEGRYDHGLANILKDAAAGESMKNRCMMALVGIGF